MSAIRPSSMDSRHASAGANIIGSDQGKTGPGPEIMAADTLKGESVINSQGQDLGKIEHIMLDVHHGRIAYAVLSVGGFLGMGDKLLAIPWAALTLDVNRRCFILDVAKDRLESAPGFDKDRWPTMADLTWASELHAYYGAPHYWE